MMLNRDLVELHHLLVSRVSMLKTTPQSSSLPMRSMPLKNMDLMHCVTGHRRSWQCMRIWHMFFPMSASNYVLQATPLLQLDTSLQRGTRDPGAPMRRHPPGSGGFC